MDLLFLKLRATLSEKVDLIPNFHDQNKILGIDETIRYLNQTTYFSTFTSILLYSKGSISTQPAVFLEPVEKLFINLDRTLYSFCFASYFLSQISIIFCSQPRSFPPTSSFLQCILSILWTQHEGVRKVMLESQYVLI